MELFANEMSIHRQFHDLPTFHGALERLMGMRGVAHRFGRNVYCHRTLAGAEPIPGIRMQQAVQRLADNRRRALMAWLTRGGPFWDDLRRHDANDWLECEGEIVTDTAVGEAAYRTLRGVECALISATPSNWDYLAYRSDSWNREAEGLDDQNATLDNWRDAAALETRLQGAVPPIRSWADLDDFSKSPIQEPDVCRSLLRRSGRSPIRHECSGSDSRVAQYSRSALPTLSTRAVSRTPEGSIAIYRDYFCGWQRFILRFVGLREAQFSH